MPKYIISVLWMVAVMTSCSENSEPQKLRIAVSSNMQFVLPEIVHSFEKENEIECELIFGSSGKLATQIITGAPFDVFVSADLFYPNQVKEHLKITESPKVYALGNMVMWTLDTSLVLSSDLLFTNQIKNIAIANPDLAPYGVAALQYLQSLDHWDSIASKLVYGENIGQVNQFVVSGNVDVGFTSKSVVLSDDQYGIGSWVAVNPKLHDPIIQYAMSLETSNHSQAVKFVNFLSSNQCRNILKERGYALPKAP